MNEKKALLKGIKEMEDERENLEWCILSLQGRIKVIEIQEEIKKMEKDANTKDEVKK